jgi:rRNA maturation RNase YbeY
MVDDYVLENSKKYKAWLHEVISEEQKLVGDLVFIFIDDFSLHEINKDFLNHDTYTDIITFNKSTCEKVISGDIYISIDRINENASINNQEFDAELSRVIVHGILHLIGFKDTTLEEKAVMRSKEDYYLNLLP